MAGGNNTNRRLISHDREAKIHKRNVPFEGIVRNARQEPEGSHNGIAAVLKTAARKGVRVRIPRPPQMKKKASRF